MVSLKLVISDPKTGKSYQRELDKEKEAQLYGRKLRDGVEGGLVGLGGYQLQVTGGSDKDGFPMNASVPGTRRYSVLLSGGAGVRGLKHGQRAKRPVRGSTVGADTAQVNLKITNYGDKPLEELGFVVKPKEAKAAEAKPAEKK